MHYCLMHILVIPAVVSTWHDSQCANFKPPVELGLKVVLNKDCVTSQPIEHATPLDLLLTIYVSAIYISGKFAHFLEMLCTF